MAITLEATRKQYFPVELSPADFTKLSVKPETLASLNSDELWEILTAIQKELNERG